MDKLSTPSDSEQVPPTSDNGGSSSSANSDKKDGKDQGPGAGQPNLAFDADGAMMSMPRSRPLGSLEGPRADEAADGPAFTINTCLTAILVIFFTAMFVASVLFLRETNEEKFQRKQKELAVALGQDKSVMRRLMAWGVFMMVGAGLLTMLLRIENNRGQPSNARYLWLALILALPIFRAMWMRKVPEVKKKFTHPGMSGEVMDFQTRSQKLISYISVGLAAAAFCKICTQFCRYLRNRVQALNRWR